MIYELINYRFISFNQVLLKYIVQDSDTYSYFRNPTFAISLALVL